MKKFALIAVIAIAGTSLVFTSCSKKKDFTCTCTVNGVALPGGPLTDQKKSVAEEACEKTESSANAQFGAGSTSCVLTEN